MDDRNYSHLYRGYSVVHSIKDNEGETIMTTQQNLAILYCKQHLELLYSASTVAMLTKADHIKCEQAKAAILAALESLPVEKGDDE